MACLAATKSFSFCSATLIAVLAFELAFARQPRQPFTPGQVYVEDNWRRLVVYEGADEDCHQVGKRSNVKEFLTRQHDLAKNHGVFNASSVLVLDSRSMDALSDVCDQNFAQSVISDKYSSNEVSDDDLFHVGGGQNADSVDRRDSSSPSSFFSTGLR